MYEPTYLTLDEAAAVCGKAKDTSRSYRRDARSSVQFKEAPSPR
jgi:hypothetical protein